MKCYPSQCKNQERQGMNTEEQGDSDGQPSGHDRKTCTDRD